MSFQLAYTPLYVRRMPVKASLGADGSNATRQRRALAQMSQIELATGLTAEELAAFHAEQRARVLDGRLSASSVSGAQR